MGLNADAMVISWVFQCFLGDFSWGFFVGCSIGLLSGGSRCSDIVKPLLNNFFYLLQGLVSMSQCFTSPNYKGDISSPTDMGR